MNLADPEQSAEGSLDPLGLYGIADELALKLCPGVRERQTRPRFLMLQVVSAAICGDFAEDRVARDGRSEPWLVFEWYAVEGLVRSKAEDDDTLFRLPGSKKVAEAVRRGLPISPQHYLKTPAVFGFHGVYRLLARTLGLVDEDGALGVAGRELLMLWEEEQGRKGFISSTHGDGRAMLVKAVEEGLKVGATNRSATWAGWDFFAQHLHPGEAGKREATWLKARLLNDHEGHRGELLRFIGSALGRKTLREHNLAERELHVALRTSASPALRTLLDAIAAYEHFARLVQDAFDACLVELSRADAQVDAAALARLKLVERAARQIPANFAKTVERLAKLGLDERFRQSFDTLSEKGDAAGWVVRLLRHHRDNQQAKLPSKRPWLESNGDSTWMVRSPYRCKEMPAGDGAYVHSYRARSLDKFLVDLKATA